jgi:GAF domain-containing protein
LPHRRRSEATRLQALHQLGILDTAEDRIFSALAQQALVVMPGTSIAAVSLVDSNRQWFKTTIGLDVRETPREVSFCSRTIESNGVMVVPDATKDSRFADNPMVTSAPGIRFYAGVSLMDGVGALCVMGQQPRMATPAEVMALMKLASYVDIQLLAHGTLHNLHGGQAARPRPGPAPAGSYNQAA